MYKVKQGGGIRIQMLNDPISKKTAGKTGRTKIRKGITTEERE